MQPITAKSIEQPWENEILREALSKAQSKKPISRPILLPKDGSRTDHLGPPFDLSIEALNRVRAVKLGPVLLGKGHVGEHIFLHTIHEASKVRHFRPDLIGDVAPLLAGGLGRVLGKSCCNESGDHASATLAGMSQRIAHEVNPPASLPSGGKAALSASTKATLRFARPGPALRSGLDSHGLVFRDASFKQALVRLLTGIV